jgi:trehalose 6-phosphate phosphatase
MHQGAEKDQAMTSTARSPQLGQDLASPPTLNPDEIALFADLDGTLAPIEATPDAVKPDPARRRLLEQLSNALQGRLAVVSGRGLADIDRVLESRIAAVAAVHGLVRRTSDGRVVTDADDSAVRQALDGLLAFAATDQGLLVENKGVAAALHYRRAPQAADAARALARDLADRFGLLVQKGDMVVELRPPGANKGDAVEAFMAEAPFAGHIPIFIGDDLTDEAGFEAVRRLGGFGVVVGPRRPTAALYALAGVAETQAWLRGLLELRP